MNFLNLRRKAGMSTVNNDLNVEDQIQQNNVKTIHSNALVTSNIIELVVSVVGNVAGKSISDSLEGSSLNRSILSNLVANRVKQQILGAK